MVVCTVAPSIGDEIVGVAGEPIHSTTTLAEAERQDLRRVDPDGGLEAGGEGAFEDEKHRCGGFAGLVGGGGVVLDLVDQGGLEWP